MKYEELINPRGMGVEIINNFASQSEIEAITQEVNDPCNIQWIDAHETYRNKRGLTIVQNHFTFALKLSCGNQSFLDRLPNTVALKDNICRFINNLADIFPALINWEADELSFHLYDDQEVGLSYHRDNLRFIGLIAITAISGECDLVINHQGEAIKLPTKPGDLCLIRGPGLIDSTAEVRPEHSVQNLRTETRVSMMIRANNRPTEAIAGFKFNNWQN